ncbi:formyltetrahydrofolate deformylase [Marinomonas sp. 15G1-11]|uniref:Formyltetrahydrofolate deformylase n=1 Tax=Marinomonas phaeophyticola TaxID=3004091 RepID=A0ABT4JYJ5_9GAMM|nr:formyltetrahydrofolate deformylase [Marinomonas sp. 15G1-11]MCZ2722823.1 formyltetrahydrofolate deformylase [Marinomonas sp. 15G1-11]
MKLKLTPTQNLCIGFLESGFKVVQIDDHFYFMKGDRKQKVLSKTLDALVNRGALEHKVDGDYELSEAFLEYRKQMRSPLKSPQVHH